MVTKKKNATMKFSTLKGLKFRKKRGGRRRPMPRRREHRPSPPKPQRDDSDVSSSEDEEGYYEVSIGDVMHGRYTVERKLGSGHFSQVWLASDSKVGDDDSNKLVAIKIQKGAEHYDQAALDEKKILSELPREDSDSKFVVNLLNFFTIHGPEGRHRCLVFETMWKDVYYLIRSMGYAGLPPPLIQLIGYQVLRGLSFLHSNNIIHTDIKPENFLITLPKKPNLLEVQSLRKRYIAEKTEWAFKQRMQRMNKGTLNKNQRRRMKNKLKKIQQQKEEQEAKEAEAKTDQQKAVAVASNASNASNYDVEKDESPSPTLTSFSDPGQIFVVKAADLGNGCWTHKHFTDDVQTRQYRAPEVLLGCPYSTPIDVFSVGIMLMELATGECIFNPDDHSSVNVRNQWQLGMMMRTLGRVPKHMVKRGKFSNNYFNRMGHLKNSKKMDFLPIEQMLKDVNFPDEHLLSFSDLIYKLLDMDPKQRIKAPDAMIHPWFEEMHKNFMTYGMEAFPYPDLRQMIMEQKRLNDEEDNDEDEDTNEDEETDEDEDTNEDDDTDEDEDNNQ
jgi:serine/threonine-protein kinase SRPK3